MKTLFSSKSDEWQTDFIFFSKLDKLFHFTLDPCATSENALCKKYFTIKEDGLNQSWNRETVFMNPPYGRIIARWVQKAYEEAKEDATVVCLVPARTDTKWMQKYARKADWIVDIGGRLTFDNKILKDEKGADYELTSAPFPSRLLIFSCDPVSRDIVEGLMQFGMVLKPINLYSLDDMYS